MLFRGSWRRLAPLRTKALSRPEKLISYSPLAIVLAAYKRHDCFRRHVTDCLELLI